VFFFNFAEIFLCYYCYTYAYFIDISRGIVETPTLYILDRVETCTSTTVSLHW